jgi:tRNA-specific 2-thiouridylase
MLDQSQLRHALFPLGGLQKQQVREIAREAGFPNHKKKDSTGICFIGERKFRDFLQRYLPATPGDIITPQGEVIGRHQGLMYYTLGQRQGLGIGGRQEAAEAPWYVVGKNLKLNQLVAAQGHDHPLLLSTTLEADQLHWIAGVAPALPLTCQARFRHRQALQTCRIQAGDDGQCRVVFEQAQRAITPGQAIVFYQQSECLGGGTILRNF